MTTVPPDVIRIPEDARERIRLAILQLKLAGEGVTQTRVRAAAKVDMRRVGPVVKAFKLGRLPALGGSWTDVGLGLSKDSTQSGGGGRDESGAEVTGVRVEIADLISAAETDEDRGRVFHLIAEAIARKGVSVAEAKALGEVLDRARMAGREHRATPQDDPERVLLISRDGATLLQGYERIVSEERRARVLELVAELVEEDLLELPTADPLGAL